MSNPLIGSGWAFPLALDVTGSFELVDDAREIEEAIALIIGTVPGERPMRPEFGCAIHDYVFEAPDATTAGRITREVRRSLRRWEPRTDLLDVTVIPDPEDPSTLYIDVSYEIRGTYDRRSLVFPFYTIPSERNGSDAARIPAGRTP